MASNFSKLNIETVNGKIQNVSSLCDYIKSTEVLDDDVSLLESLANKLANDNNTDNNYTNEEPLVYALHAKLLEYYINTYNFDIDQVLDTIEVFNKDFKNVRRIKYNGNFYLIYNRINDIDVICINDENKFLELVLNNLEIIVSKPNEKIYELFKNNLNAIDFIESTDEEVIEYSQTFGIDNKVYFGKDVDGNHFYKLKNAFITKNDDGINVLLNPTFEEDNKYKVVQAKERYQSFDLEDFKHLSNRVLNQIEMTDDETARFYYEVRFLINTMIKRDEIGETELKEALDKYMEPLVNIYNITEDVLSENDQRNVIDYLNNLKKLKHKSK